MFVKTTLTTMIRINFFDDNIDDGEGSKRNNDKDACCKPMKYN